MDDFLIGDRHGKLGNYLESFRPMPANIVAGTILSLSSFSAAGIIVWLIVKEIVQAGGKLPLLVEKGPCWLVFASFLLFAAGLAFVGYWILKLSLSLIGISITFYSEGFCSFVGETELDVPWKEVVGIRETVVYQRPPILKYPAILLLPKLASYSYLIEMTSRKTCSFDGNTVGKIKRLGLLLRTEARRRGIVWETFREDHGR